MPELPEVETVVRDLKPHLKGRRILAVRVGKKRLRRPWQTKWGKVLIGRKIEWVFRRGKWIILWLAKSDDIRYLVIHLGMTGQLTIVPSSEPPVPHTHLVLILDGGKEIRFRDIRRFGSAALLTRDELNEQVLGELGPEPSKVRPNYWQKRLTATRRCLKALLLDQRVICGVGNIYADESLFEARLHPARLGCDLDAIEAACLRQAIRTVLRRAIRRRGSSIRNYVGGSGRQGEYQNEFRVYGRTDEPCPRCQTPIACVRLAGRSTHFCPRCQKK